MTMSPTAFHRFGELPKELQIQIWSLAATADIELEDDRSYDTVEILWLLRSGRALCSVSNFILKTSRRHQLSGTVNNLAVLEDTCRLRAVMMMTSRISRQVAIEMWRRDLESKMIGARFYGCVIVKEKDKIQIKAYLDGLLQ